MSCVFCDITAGRAPASVILEDHRHLALLDIRPVRPGHTLVIPRRHAVRLEELGDEAPAFLAFGERVARAVRRGTGCDVNLLLNDGRDANQTVPHAHLHVIPRRRGDLGKLVGRLLLRTAAPRAELEQMAARLKPAPASGRDRLFVYPPGFQDRGRTWFCPYSAQVMGFLSYYPRVRETLEVVELGFEKPRRPLSDLLGEAHQAAPVLVLGGAPAEVPGITVGEAGGHRFVEKTIEILRYLAATRGVPPPH